MTKLPDYYRPIETNGIEPVKPIGNVGTPLRMQWIAIEKLFVDMRFQRPIAKGFSGNVRQIGRDFRWRRFAPVIVTPIPEAPGYYSVIDGQHKSTGALLRGLKNVPCAVVEADTIEEQADAFKYLNANVTRVSAFDIYTANVAAKDTHALRVADLAKQSGIRLLTSSPRARPKLVQGDCTTYKTFAAFAKSMKESTFVFGMTALANNPNTIGIINSVVIGAVCQVLKSNKGWDGDAHVAAILKSLNIRAMLNTAISLHKQENSTVKAVLIRLLYERVMEYLMSH